MASLTPGVAVRTTQSGDGVVVRPAKFATADRAAGVSKVVTRAKWQFTIRVALSLAATRPTMSGVLRSVSE
jgi:hypothetical protein